MPTNSAQPCALVNCAGYWRPDLAVGITLTPLTGLPLASRTFTTSEPLTGGATSDSILTGWIRPLLAVVGDCEPPTIGDVTVVTTRRYSLCLAPPAPQPVVGVPLSTWSVTSVFTKYLTPSTVTSR